jgi:hypothetical protein
MVGGGGRGIEKTNQNTSGKGRMEKRRKKGRRENS